MITQPGTYPEMQKEWARANKDASDKIRIAAEQDWEEWRKRDKGIKVNRQREDKPDLENDNHIHGTGCEQPMGIISYNKKGTK